jgi:hypothetical protein
VFIRVIQSRQIFAIVIEDTAFLGFQVKIEKGASAPPPWDLRCKIIGETLSLGRF